MPALEIGINPGRDGRQDLTQRACMGIRSKRRRDEFANNSGVESVACKSNANVAQEILRSTSTPAYVGADLKQGETAGSSAKVTNENQLIVVQGRLVSV